jgi:streptogramin lyase
MHHVRVPRLVSVGLLFALGACQGAVPPPASVGAPSAADSSATPTVKPLGEHVIAEWEVSSPADIYAASGSVWVVPHGGETVRIDPTSNKIVEGVSPVAPMPFCPCSTHNGDGEGFGSLWIATQDNKLDRIDPTTRKLIASIVLDGGAVDILNGLVVTTTAVWVFQSDRAALIKVDPATNRIVSKTSWGTLIADGAAHTGIPVGKGADFMWLNVVGDEGQGFQKGLLRLDPNSGAALTFLAWSADHDGDGPITVTEDAVWHSAGGHIYRVDIATNRIDATYPTDSGIVHLAIGFGSVWSANYDLSLVQRLDITP